MSTPVAASAGDVFVFFSKPANAGLLMPAAMQFRIVGPAPELSENVTIDCQFRAGPMRVRWRTRIAAWDPPRSYAGVQETGPYRAWRHEHVFITHNGGTIVEDRVYYAPPLGPLAGVVNHLLVARSLRSLFRYRADVIKLRFGSQTSA
jgi:hypothetical protein